MNRAPTYDDIIYVMAKASVGEADARVALPEAPDPDDTLSSLAIALNILLDDLDLQHRELRRSHDEIQAQQEAIRRLSIPVLVVAEGVLLLPLLGLIDSERAGQMMEAALQWVHAAKARAIIIDMTGVPDIDVYAAGSLRRLTDGVRLLGAEVIIAGISAEVAKSMTASGIELRNMRTESNLASAIASATRVARLGNR